MRMQWFFLACVGFFLIVPAALQMSGQAQSSDPLYDAQGFQQGRAYLSELPFEHIDTMTGNVLLTFTDLVLPGNAGLDVEIVRAYNSKAPEGWTFGLGGYPYRIDNPDGVPATVDPFATDPRPYFPRLRMPDGSRPEVFSESQYTFPVFRTNQFWRYDVSGRRLQRPDGTEAFYSATGLLSYVQDTFGNRINLTYTTSDSLQQISQVLGAQVRTVWFGGGAPPGAVPASMTYNGHTWNYYSNTGALYQFTPPTGPSWQFEYEVNLPGVIGAVVTPNGGRVEYDFSIQSFASSGPYPVSTRVLLNRRTNGTNISTPGSWSYGYSYRLGESNSVAGPNNTSSQYEYTTPTGATEPVLQTVTHSDVLQTEREFRTYQVQSVTEWGGGPIALLSSRAITRNGQTYTTTFSYGTSNFADFGRPTTVQENGTLQRTTTYAFDYDFDSNRWIKDKIASKTVSMGADSFIVTRSYNNTTGFMESQARYGVTMQFGSDPNGSGNVERTIDAHGHITRYVYDWGVVQDTITPMHTISRTINQDGTVASETRGGNTTAFSYDALGRQTWVIPPAGFGYGVETQYTSSDIRQIRSDGGSAGGRTSRTTTLLDGFGRVIGTENTQGVKTSIRYDALGQKVFESLPFESTAEVGTTYTYDGLGRVLTMQKSGGQSTTYSYGLSGAVTISETNFPDTRVTIQNWAAFGDPSDRLLIGVTDAEGSSWAYEYNALGRLKRVAQPGGPPRVWTYDGSSDRVASESDPENGLTTYWYDSAGLLSTKGTQRAQLTYSYDNNDRLSGISSGYPNEFVSIGYDAADNRTSLVTGYVTSTFHYDAASRLDWRTDTITGVAGDGPRQTTYSYNGWDDVVGIQYPSGRSVTYEYDSESRPRKVFTQGGVLVAEVVAYHPAGGITTLRLGNGITEEFGYDANRYWPTSISGGPVHLTYGYDQVGNVSTIADHVSWAFNQNFTYDRLDRLTSIGGFGGTGFQYDALGNRTSKSTPSLTYTYDYWKRLSTVSGSLPNPEVGNYVFDTAGGMTSDPSGSYAYTPFDMLASASVGGATTMYRYDGDNIRKSRIRSTGFDFFYHGMDESLLSEFHHTGVPPGVWVRDYIYLGSRLVASIHEVQPGIRFVQGASTGSEGSQQDITVVLDALPSGLSSTLSVDYVTVPGQGAVAGTDYTSISGTITFPSGSQNGATQAISLPLLRDRVNDPNETVVIQLRDSSTAAVIATHTVTITNSPVVPGDLDNDGRVDLIWQHRNGTGQLTAWFMDGTVKLDDTLLSPSSVADQNWQIVGSGDYNQDGYMDIYWQHQTTGALSVWEMGQNGSGTAQRAGYSLSPSSVPDTNWKVRTVADMDQDGYPDLIWQNVATGQLSIWWMNGLSLKPNGGELLDPPDVPVSTTWTIVGAGDVNRDGYPDLFWHKQDEGFVSVWYMQGSSQISGQSIVPDGVSDTNWKVRGVGDLDGNGYPDLIWQNVATREVSAWLMTGINLTSGQLLTPLSVLPDTNWTVVVPK